MKRSIFFYEIFFGLVVFVIEMITMYHVYKWSVLSE